MKTLRDAWANASDAVKIAIVAAVVIVILAALGYGLGMDWFVNFFGAES